MNTITFWNPSDQSLVWGMNAILQVTVITVTALLIGRLLSQKSTVRYGMLCVSLALVLSCPLIAYQLQKSGTGWWSLTLRSASSASRDSERSPDEADTETLAPSNSATTGSGRLVAEVRNSDNADIASEFAATTGQPTNPRTVISVSSEPQLDSDKIAQNDSSDRTDNHLATTEVMREAPPQRAGFLMVVTSTALLVWVAGAVLLLLRMSIAWIRLARILQRATPNSNDDVQAKFNDVLLVLQANGSAPQYISQTQLLMSDQVSGPIATGLIRPRIVLPSNLIERVTDKQLRDILLHEAAHIARRDQWIVCLQNVVGSIFWAHPLVAMLNRRIAQAREEICDNHVLSETDASTYSRTLLALAELIASPKPMPGTVGLFGSHWKLESRVAGLLDERRSRLTRMTSRGRCLVAAATFAFLAVAAMGTIQLAAEQQKPVKKAVKKPADNKTSADESETKTDLAAALREVTGKPSYASGTVTNDSGKPVPGAFVAVVGLNFDQSSRSGELLAEGVTNKKGEYKLTMRGVSAKTHRYSNVIARTDDSALAWKAIDLDEKEALIDLELAPQVLIKLRLVNIEGEPLADLSVELRGMQPTLGKGKGTPQQGVGFSGIKPYPKAAPPLLKTDADGVLTIRHVPADHGVFAHLSGNDDVAPQQIMLNSGLPEQRGANDGTYRPLVRNVKPGEVATVAVSPAQWFKGVVLLGDSGKPAVNAKMVLSSSQQELGGSATSVEGTTDAEGRFEINANPGVRFRIVAHPPTGQPFQVKELRDLKWSADDSSNIEIQLVPGLIAQGKIVDAKTGKPLEAASVQYHPDRAHNKNITPGLVTGWQGIQKTDKDGKFSLPIVAGPGTLIVHAADDSNYVLSDLPSRELDGQTGGPRTYAHAFHTIEPSDEKPLEPLTIKLQPGSTVKAKIVDSDGKPVKQFVTVSRLHGSPYSPIWRASPRRGKNGEVEFAGLAEGEVYSVFVLDPKRNAALAELRAGDKSTTVKLIPCGSATAKFVYPDGKPSVEKMYALTMVARPGANRFDIEAIQSGKPIADADYSSNVDQFNRSLTDSVTNEQGVSEYLSLIPGATYRFVLFGSPKIKIVSEFKAESGKKFDMGTITVPR